MLRKEKCMLNNVQNLRMSNKYQVGFRAQPNKKFLTETIGLTQKEAETFLKRNKSGSTMLDYMSSNQFLFALKASKGIQEKWQSAAAKIENAFMNGKVSIHSHATELIKTQF